MENKTNLTKNIEDFIDTAYCFLRKNDVFRNNKRYKIK